MKLLLGVVACVVLLNGVVYGLDNGAAVTPPMGWLAWERFRCIVDCTADPDNCISENLFLTMGKLLVSTGLKDAGYIYVNIDDCWQNRTRNSEGYLEADSTRFPHGIAWLADQMHGMGLKLGIYEDYGNYTCGGYPGSYGYLQMDADTFADWRVDSLKLDGCYAEPQDYAIGYPQMTKYLNGTHRQIMYSCSWPAYIDFSTVPWAEVAKDCNLWRLYDDIEDSWDSVYSIIEYWGQQQDTLQPIAAPGSWNDPDMLLTGDFSLSQIESQTQFAMWAMFAAPLYMSNDLRTISKEALDILLNKEVIAVNQDPLGIQGRLISSENQLEVWARPLSKGEVAVALFCGRDDGTPFPISFNFTAVGIRSTKVLIRDLFLKKDLGTFGSPYSADVNIHGVVLLKLTPQ